MKLLKLAASEMSPSMKEVNTSLERCVAARACDRGSACTADCACQPVLLPVPRALCSKLCALPSCCGPVLCALWPAPSLPSSPVAALCPALSGCLREGRASARRLLGCRPLASWKFITAPHQQVSLLASCVPVPVSWSLRTVLHGGRVAQRHLEHVSSAQGEAQGQHGCADRLHLEQGCCVRVWLGGCVLLAAASQHRRQEGLGAQEAE